MKTAYIKKTTMHAGNKFKTFLDFTALWNVPYPVTGGRGQYIRMKEIFRHRDHNKKFTVLNKIYHLSNSNKLIL